MADEENQGFRPGDAGFKRFLAGQLNERDIETVVQHAQRHGLLLVEATVALGFLNEMSRNGGNLEAGVLFAPHDLTWCAAKNGTPRNTA